MQAEEERQRVLDEVERQQTEFGTEKQYDKVISRLVISDQRGDLPTCFLYVTKALFKKKDYL